MMVETNNVYYVTAGDTLTSISDRFDISIDELQVRNDIANPDLVFINQSLIVGGTEYVATENIWSKDTLPVDWEFAVLALGILSIACIWRYLHLSKHKKPKAKAKKLDHYKPKAKPKAKAKKLDHYKPKAKPKAKAKKLDHYKHLTGRAWVTDGDGLHINGYEIRLAGLDAPELKQKGINYSGKSIDIGFIVKAYLIKKVGGKQIEVYSSGIDKYGRLIGTVYYNNLDVNKWMVSMGYAIAAYGNQYKTEETIARTENRGIWALRMDDPRDYRAIHKEKTYNRRW